MNPELFYFKNEDCWMNLNELVSIDYGTIHGRQHLLIVFSTTKMVTLERTDPDFAVFCDRINTIYTLTNREAL